MDFPTQPGVLLEKMAIGSDEEGRCMKNFLGLVMVLGAVGCGSGSDSVNLSSNAVGSAGSGVSASADEARVEFVRQSHVVARGEDRLALMIDGQAVFLQGAGGPNRDRPAGGLTPFSSPYSYMNDLVAAGANCVRTYGTSFVFDDAQTQAQDVAAAFSFAARARRSKPIYVLVGLFMTKQTDKGTGAKGNGVDYSNPAQVSEQEALLLQVVDQVLLLDQSVQVGWCVGNEVLADDPQVQQKIWQSTDRIAVAIQAKSKLPVMTAHPTVTVARLQEMNTAMPHLDWLGINNYAGVFSNQPPESGGFLWQLPATMEQAEASGAWDKPWVVSEFGSYDLPGRNIPALGPYTLEANSTTNAANYANSFSQYIAGAQSRNAHCVGGLVLNWMQPIDSEMPAFFLDMYAFRGQPNSRPFEAVWNNALADRLQCTDALAALWGGSISADPCPQIVVTDGDNQGIACSFKATESNLNPTPVAQGANLTASLTATDNGPVTVDWYLVGGQVSHNLNQAGRQNPQDYGSTSIYLGSGQSASNAGQTLNTITFTPPTTTGNVYQLRAIVRDNTGSATTSGGAATAAIVFRT